MLTDRGEEVKRRGMPPAVSPRLIHEWLRLVSRSLLHYPGIRRWLGLLTMLSMVYPWARAGASGSLTERIELSAEEQAWVAAHPVIKVGADPDWPPFSSLSEGRTRGIDPDLLTILGARLGLQIEFVTRS
ncbi:MAG TPA: transporter substrate-binding domain-containing protein, partial [Opitutus sp.]|nr:transporter substrate-binding domain-containing protein [Opitutus sp.]